MFFKVITLYTIANISALLFILYFFTGIRISQGEAWYFLVIPIVFALVNYFIDPIIKFFTLKVTFLTIWLFNFLVYMPLLYFITAVLPGITVKAGVFRSINIGVFQIVSFQMPEITTIIVSCVLFGFTAATIRWLIGSKS